MRQRLPESACRGTKTGTGASHQTGIFTRAGPVGVRAPAPAAPVANGARARRRGRDCRAGARPPPAGNALAAQAASFAGATYRFPAARFRRRKTRPRDAAGARREAGVRLDERCARRHSRHGATGALRVFTAAHKGVPPAGRKETAHTGSGGGLHASQPPDEDLRQGSRTPVRHPRNDHGSDLSLRKPGGRVPQRTGQHIDRRKFARRTEITAVNEKKRPFVMPYRIFPCHTLCQIVRRRSIRRS